MKYRVDIIGIKRKMWISEKQNFAVWISEFFFAVSISEKKKFAVWISEFFSICRVDIRKNRFCRVNIRKKIFAVWISDFPNLNNKNITDFACEYQKYTHSNHHSCGGKPPHSGWFSCVYFVIFTRKIGDILLIFTRYFTKIRWYIA